MATITRPKPKPDSSSAGDLGAAASSRSDRRGAERRRQLPWVVLGVLIVAGAGLGFALWAQAQSERTAALVAARDIDAGEVLGRDDLRQVPIGADPGVGLLAVGAASDLYGQTARGPIPEGTPLQAEMFSDGVQIPEGHAVVGASLTPGEYPASSMRPGDVVELIEVTARGAQDGDEARLGTATVWSIEQLDLVGEPRLFVAVLVDDDLAGAVANAASLERLRVVLIPGAAS